MDNPGWSYDDILPYYKKSERIQITKYDHGYHGENGEIFINYTSPDPYNFQNFLTAITYLGFKEIDYNGTSRFQWTIDFYKRQYELLVLNVLRLVRSVDQLQKKK